MNVLIKEKELSMKELYRRMIVNTLLIGNKIRGMNVINLV